jgi:conjugal transfer pilus assembly protein TraW
MFVVRFLIILLASTNTTIAKDYGVRAQVFEIAENSLLEVIQKRLLAIEKEGKISQIQQAFVQKVKQKVVTPPAVKGIIATRAKEEFFFEPSYLHLTDIKDHVGGVIIKAGTIVNPLADLSWGQPLIFIDGLDAKQVEWSIKQEAKIVLVNGSPLELSQKYDRWFYFDQGGVLTSKFAIKQVPAIVAQDGMRLKINELKL